MYKHRYIRISIYSYKLRDRDTREWMRENKKSSPRIGVELSMKQWARETHWCNRRCAGEGRSRPRLLAKRTRASGDRSERFCTHIYDIHVHIYVAVLCTYIQHTYTCMCSVFAHIYTAYKYICMYIGSIVYIYNAKATRENVIQRVLGVLRL